ncbi:MAG: hypothetical protein AB1656_06105 [Candidatus Omnitrophota bacterium]
MAQCTDTLGRGWEKTIQIMFQPFRFIYWLKMAILFFLIHQLSGVNLVMQAYSRFASPYIGLEADDMRNYDVLLEKITAALPMILLGLMGLGLLMILFMFFQSAIRFVIYDGVRSGMVYYLRYFSKHISQIVSYFLWNIAISIITVILTSILFGFILLLAWATNVSLDNTAGLAIFIMASIGVFLFVIAISILYISLLDCLVLPIMLVKECGILTAWSQALKLAFGNFWEFIGFIILRVIIIVVISVIMMILSFIVLFSVGILISLLAISSSNVLDAAGDNPLALFDNIYFTIVMLPFSFLLTFILLPLPVFKDAYSLCFMARLTGDSSFEPITIKKTQPQEIKSDSPVTVPSSGPVLFREIAPEAAPSETIVSAHKANISSIDPPLQPQTQTPDQPELPPWPEIPEIKPDEIIPPPPDLPEYTPEEPPAEPTEPPEDRGEDKDNPPSPTTNNK